VINEATKKEIDKVVMKTLKEAGMREPPFLVNDLLDSLKIDREFYDLEDPSLIRRFVHKVKVKGELLLKIKEKINLAAMWLPFKDRRDLIYVDSSLPQPKKEWASFHDITHGILEWHRPYFLGDTAQTLDPDFQDALESEAHYGASGLMFGGNIFTRDALDTTPEWAGIELLKKTYRTSYVTTLRRYVQFSHDIPMTFIVSTAKWMEKPDDQEDRCRHFIKSKLFKIQFACISKDFLLKEIDVNTTRHIGGPVGEFSICLPDINGALHEFYAESFFNRHYVLTLIVHHKPIRHIKQ
jgi:hypothetical protein